MKKFQEESSYLSTSLESSTRFGLATPKSSQKFSVCFFYFLQTNSTNQLNSFFKVQINKKPVMEEIDCSATAHEASVLRLSTLTSTSNDSVKAAEIYYDIEVECSHCNFSTYSIEIIQLHEVFHV